MRDSFVCDRFVLDLSRVQTSYVEENPRFSDSFFTKYSLPFEFYLHNDLRMKMGHYDDLNAFGLDKKIEGYHIFEGRVKTAVLEILEVEGNLVKAQLDSGFEELPSFGRSLKSIMGKKSDIIRVADIYEHANEVCKKKYPETPYNFPRVIYDKHSADEKGWEVFNQFLNDRDENGFVDNNEDGSDWNELADKDKTDENDFHKFHKNRNIIHPMPYVLHILKKGFASSGYELKGDILTDADFLQRVVYAPNAEYAVAKEGKTEFCKIMEDDKHESWRVIDTVDLYYYIYSKEIEIPYGEFVLQGMVLLHPYNLGMFKRYAVLQVLLNGVEIKKEVRRENDTYNMFFPFSNYSNVGRLEIRVGTSVPKQEEKQTVADLRVDFRKDLNKNGDKIQLLNNRNEFSLADFVPNMTFGDFLRTIKMWKNYDIAVKDNTVIMNRLNTSLAEKMRDISQFAIATPIKTFLKKRSFSISFPEIEGKKETLIINHKGHKINASSPQNTTGIAINGYCLPIETFRRKTTAKPKIDDESVLGLIYYDGLHNGNNFAQNKAGLMLPDIIDALLPWYQQRIVSNEFRWSFYANKNRWRHIDVKDTLFVYGHKVWIREINKTVIDEKTYQIEIVVESVR